LYIYLSNEQAVMTNVYFDDLKITYHGGVEQVSDYYPFGLIFNDLQGQNSVANKYLFNGGSELQTNLNLGVYFTTFRVYDPVLGRFWQTDPLTDFFSGITPYNFADNNPVLYGDPSGLKPNIWQRIKVFFGIGRFSGTRAAGNQEYVKPAARNNGEKKPYYFPVNVYSQKPTAPTKQQQSAQTVAQEETEEDPEEEPSVIYIPPAPILTSKSKPQLPKPTNPVITRQPDPVKTPLRVKPGGSLIFDGYQFEIDKADLYSTPANDKLISDLITTLKSSSSYTLEIKGNVNQDPDNLLERLINHDHQDKLTSGRAKAIYDALKAAGIPASQLEAHPGEIRKSQGNMSATFILKNK
jgi:RHS repeat-associated protein